jgi:hypothetical protein
MRPEVKYGLAAGVAIVLVSLIVDFSGNTETAIGALLSWVGYILLAAAIYMAIKERREMQAGLISYGKGVGSGVLTSLNAGLLVGIYQYILLKFIRHDQVQVIYEKMTDMLEEKQDLTPDQIESFKKYMKLFSGPGANGIAAIIAYVIIGLILALIISAILKKENSNPLIEN